VLFPFNSTLTGFCIFLTAQLCKTLDICAIKIKQ
jgi:hypothetical protein